MIGFIDPPSPVASIQEWKQFLNDILKLDQNDPDVRKYVTEAKEKIAKNN